MSVHTVYEGRVFSVEVDLVTLLDGREHEIAIVRHGPSIVLIPVQEDGNVILVRQYRHATGTRLLEICAGGLKPGEDPLEAARRELEEETGYLAGKLVERARFWTTPGFTTEFMYLYEATDLVKTQTNPDEDEIIDVEIATPEDSLRMIDDGRIQDAKSILGLLRVLPRR